MSYKLFTIKKTGGHGPWSGIVCTDGMRVTQILINLISNAIKYTQTGEVTIQTELDYNNNTLKFSVNDTGVGMSAEQI